MSLVHVTLHLSRIQLDYYTIVVLMMTYTFMYHFTYLLHVIDISNPEWETQKKTVEKILATILGDKFDQTKIIEIWNKSDLLDKEDLIYFINFSKRNKNAILFSSKSFI